MSRRCLVSKHPDRTATVGWDAPLATFFVQVHDQTLDDDDQVVFWRGASKQGEIPTLEELLKLLRPHAVVDELDLVALQADWHVNDGGEAAQAEADRIACEAVRAANRDCGKALAALKTLAQRPREGVSPSMEALQRFLATATS